MRLWSGFAVLSALVWIGAPATASVAPPPSGIADVVLDNVGAGFELVRDAPGPTDSLTRVFRNGARELTITGFPVTTPPGPRVLFEALTATDVGLDIVPEPEFELGSWIVAPGGAPGDVGLSAIVVASSDHVFSITLIQPLGDEFDGPSFVFDIARRQIDAAGGQVGPDDTTPPRDVGDEELLQYIPTAPPPGFGLATDSMTVTGADDIEVASAGSPEAAAFLNDRAKNVARVWGGDGVTLGVGVTRYPYDIFAAVALGFSNGFDEIDRAIPLEIDLRDAIAFHDTTNQQVGVVFRRGDVVVTVLAEYVAPPSSGDAIAATIAMADTVAAGLPRGGSSPYEFPDPPTRIVGLLLTAAFVSAAVGGSTAVARLRARRVRRRWSPSEAPALDWAAPGTPASHVIALDDDAAVLRRRGRVVAVVQLITVNIGVVALAGDFAWAGVAVAATSLLVGLGFSRWWLRREHGLLGPAAPPRGFLVPRFWGAVTGVAAFSVLGVGIAYFLKGVRYVTFNPTLAQIRWSDLLGVAPRTVGVIFAAGGLATTAFGAVLFRIARSLSRARVEEVLAADPRPPTLYLRSFGDDSLPLPIIASSATPPLRAVLGPRCRPVRGGGRVGARQLRPGCLGRTTGGLAPLARRGARTPLRRDVAQRDRGTDGRCRPHRAGARRDGGTCVGAERDRAWRASRQDDLRLPPVGAG